MSLEIINIFTSGKNIDYLRDYLNENIKDEYKKSIVLDNLIEDIFNFPDIGLLDNTRQRLRRSVDVWEEVRLLNKTFIENKISFSQEIDILGEESYEMNMFADEIAGYEHLNKHRQAFGGMYHNRSNYETTNDEFDESELSHIRSYWNY